MKVIRTERGWAGHFVGAESCRFRRNTLLEYDGCKIVVSTVGLWKPQNEFEPIGAHDRYFETMAFYSRKDDKRYNDADVSRDVSFESQWAINRADADDEANDMHEAAVEEISNKLLTRKII